MKKWMRWTIVLTVVALLAVAWTWRYVTLNQYYDDLDNSGYALYQLGETVPFGVDGNDSSTDLNGYYFRVDKIEIVEYEAYLDRIGVTLEPKADDPDRLVLVYATLINESCAANPVMLTDMKLRGVDSSFMMDRDVLRFANEWLGFNVGLALDPGTEQQMVLPYEVHDEKLRSETVAALESYEMYLQVTSVYTTKEILVNG